jgi:hypothetical protein
MFKLTDSLRPLFRLGLALAAAGLLGSCAEPVADVNRVQGNYTRKADLEGEWYMLTTVVDMPPTRAVSFPGETGKMERVRFEFRENELVAYRAYPLLEGADAPSTKVPFDGTDAPLAAWPIESHFDIRRDYNSSTGEQSNVIDENTTDRLWFEREYVRVDWSVSDIRNFDFVLNFTWEDDYDWTGNIARAVRHASSVRRGGGPGRLLPRDERRRRDALLRRAREVDRRAELLLLRHGLVGLRRLRLRRRRGHHADLVLAPAGETGLRAVPVRRQIDESFRLLPLRDVHLDEQRGWSIRAAST